MDQAFFRRAKRLLERQRTPLSFAQLSAQVAVRQAGSPTAQASAAPQREPQEADGADALAALVLVEEDWRRAVSTQGGCFSRAVAKRRVKEP